MITVKRNLDFPEIRGKEFIIDREMTFHEVNQFALMGNKLFTKFVFRRPDFLSGFGKKVYRGRTSDGFECIVAEDELEEVVDSNE